MKLIVVCLIAFSLFPMVGNVPRSNAAAEHIFLQETQDAKIVKIVTDPALWSKDFPSLLTTLKSLNRVGETKVSVLSNQAFGETKFSELNPEFKGKTGELHSLMNTPPKLKPGVEASLNETWNQPLNTVTAVGQPSTDDGSLRVTLTSKAVVRPEFLAPGLTLGTVRQENGEPEKISRRVVSSGGDERRPVILTLYHYAGDAVIFAVSDMSPEPEKIDRAILDTAKISKAIFVNPQN